MTPDVEWGSGLMKRIGKPLGSFCEKLQAAIEKEFNIPEKEAAPVVAYILGAFPEYINDAIDWANERQKSGEIRETP
jgi:hypothetical protein